MMMIHHQLNVVIYVNQLFQVKVQLSSDKQRMVHQFHMKHEHRQVRMKHRWLMEIVQEENEDDHDLVNLQL